MSPKADSGNEASDGATPASRTRQQPGAACDECRRRKLRCDRQRPRCSTCHLSGIQCVIPVTRPSRGPQRGYLRSLQGRIAALEGVIREHPQLTGVPEDATQAPTPDSNSDTAIKGTEYEQGKGGNAGEVINLNPKLINENMGFHGQPDAFCVPFGEKDVLSATDVGEGWIMPPQYPIDMTYQNSTFPPMNFDFGLQFMTESCVDVEELPDLKKVDLDQLYMDRVDMFIPILHHQRYFSWSKCDSRSLNEAQTALQYAMWTLAASVSVYHLALRDVLYQRTRQALENFERQNMNSGPVAIECVQTWLLLAVYELTAFGFSRAWISAGKAFRLIQLDPSWAAGEDSPTEEGNIHYGSDGHSGSWVESEQKRRTFWFAYCLDRLFCLRNGSFPTFHEKLINMTKVPVRLPSPEPAFQYNQPVLMGFLLDENSMLSPAASTWYPTFPFGEFIVVATVGGHVLSHRNKVTAAAAASTNGTEGNTSIHDDLWDRHILLNSLVCRSMDAFFQHHPRAAQEQDPHLLFLSITWRTIAIYLWHTTESMRAPVQAKHQALRERLSQQAKKLVHEIMSLMGKLSDMSNLKIHPLMIVPLTLCGELLALQPDLMEAFTRKLTDISQKANGLRLSLAEE
ncbi:hypothetical protein F4777DRAFT_588866 [Nemania sp. FL0916]|nr:hypothetical protein F4777DRAFT_588866 [Nemania sp. FL0916]